MADQLKEILDISRKKTVDYTNYTEYYLDNYLKVKNDNVLQVLKRYVEESLFEIKIYYNSQTETFNNIGIIDLDDYRVIDLDDDNYTMTNKGIDKSIELKIE